MATEILPTVPATGKVTAEEVREVFRRSSVRMALLMEGVFQHRHIETAICLRAIFKTNQVNSGILWIIGDIVCELEKLVKRLEEGNDWEEPEMTGEACNIIGILNLAESSGLIYRNFSETASDRVLYGLVETLYEAHHELGRALNEIDQHLAKGAKEAATEYPSTQEIILGPDELALIGSYQQISNEEQRQFVRDHASIFAALPA